MNWKFWKKKDIESSVEPEVKWSWNVDISMYTGNAISFSVECAENADYKNLFKDFYCWHKFGKTDEYEFVYNNGSYLFNRKDIRLVHYHRKKKCPAIDTVC